MADFFWSSKQRFPISFPFIVDSFPIHFLFTSFSFPAHFLCISYSILISYSFPMHFLFMSYSNLIYFVFNDSSFPIHFLFMSFHFHSFLFISFYLRNLTKFQKVRIIVSLINLLFKNYSFQTPNQLGKGVPHKSQKSD